MKYRKRPVVINAIQWAGRMADLDPLFQDGTTKRDRVFMTLATGALQIKTLEGTMECPIGSWVIKGVEGELYPCRNDIFHATYERVEEEIPETSG